MKWRKCESEFGHQWTARLLYASAHILTSSDPYLSYTVAIECRLCGFQPMGQTLGTSELQRVGKTNEYRTTRENAS